jgi:hypothetical protein
VEPKFRLISLLFYRWNASQLSHVYRARTQGGYHASLHTHHAGDGQSQHPRHRMWENPRDGVCNKFGQAHDVRNLFISDGSQSSLPLCDATTHPVGLPHPSACRRPTGKSLEQSYC